tara:strand:+ start:66 stop:518 length:453 start_codon:yes stop_codon:yes gene_type:complete
MQSFEVKRGHGKTLENGGLKSLMEEEFGEVQEAENLFTASFKALKNINVEFVSITEIRVKTETDIEASPEDSLDAHQAYNRFMEAATSFNAKQRVDRAKAKAKKEAKAAAEKEMAAEKAAEESTEEPAEEESEESEEEPAEETEEEEETS